MHIMYVYIIKIREKTESVNAEVNAWSGGIYGELKQFFFLLKRAVLRWRM